MKIRFARSLSILFGTFFMMALAILSSTAAFADSTPGSTIVNGAGSVTEAVTAPTIPTVTLGGVDQTIDFTLPITVVDATGTGNGWNLTITSTTFSTGGGSPHTLSTGASTITGVTATCVSGSTCTSATNAITYPLAVPAGATAPTASKFFNAAVSSGLGKFTITPTIAVNIPANTYASASGYSSTITVAVVSGP
jgi:hypothetical protein